jgi:hypothetical protein
MMTYPSVSGSLSAGPSSKPFVGTTLTQQKAPLADVQTTCSLDTYSSLPFLTGFPNISFVTYGIPHGCVNLRTATSLLGATFQCHYRESPFHLQGNQELRPLTRQLLRALENVDPPPK